MVENEHAFERRVSRLERQHRLLARGYRGRVREDGLIVAAPAPLPRRHSAWPLLVVIALVCLMKGTLIAVTGPDEYAARVDRLAAGTLIDRASAAVMAPDVISGAVASTLRPHLRRLRP